MRTSARLFIVLITAGWLLTASGADIERLELHQKADVAQHHLRFVGNLRAQAKREGVIVSTPQLYVYHADHSAAWHLQGFRRGFERELALIHSRNRRERSMVRIDRLLERTQTPDGQAFAESDLPSADLYLLLYRSADCEQCAQVETTLDDWLQTQPELDAVWFDVWLDGQDDS
ncbi:MAG TPA: hypothetical protein VK064_04565 [Wenzhouxiangella sp.]|nr:hypothetical protein [Wenzhouxiangella sp.]